jgi:Putative zinc-finger
VSALTCERVRRNLSAYHDRRLSPAAARALTLHMAVCAACGAERDALERLSSAAAEWPLEHPAPGLADRARNERSSTNWPWRLAGAALLVAGLGFAYALGLRHGAVEVSVPPVASSPRAEPGGLRRVFDLPTDGTALRAARSLFADLELLDGVPTNLHEAMLRPQVERYDLAQWAARRGDEPALAAVAELVQRLDRGLVGGLESAELASLRAQAERPELWGATLAVLPPAAVPRSDLDALLDRYSADLSPATRTSLGRWMAFKDQWIRGPEDMGVLWDLIDELGPTLPSPQAPDFTLPDLEGLYGSIEWTVDEDGVRHGRLEVERQTGNGSSVLRVEVRSSSTWTGGEW